MVQVSWLSLAITIIWLVGMGRAVNWIDGLGGLAAVVSDTAAVVMLMVTLFMEQSAAALIVTAIIGGNRGFVRYNFNPLTHDC